MTCGSVGSATSACPDPTAARAASICFCRPATAARCPKAASTSRARRTNRAFLLGRAFLDNDDPAAGGPAHQAGAPRSIAYAPGAYGTEHRQLPGAAKPRSPAPGVAPSTTRFVEGSGSSINTIPPNDVSFYEMLDAAVQLDRRRCWIRSWPVSSPRSASSRTSRSARRAHASRSSTKRSALATPTARDDRASRPRDSEGFDYYDSRSTWTNPLFVGGYEFLRPAAAIGQGGVHQLPDPDARTLNARIGFFYLATGITPAMCMRLTGIGSQYLGTFTDAQGRPFDGAQDLQVGAAAEHPGRRSSGRSRSTTTRRARCCRRRSASRVPAARATRPRPRRPAHDGSTTIYFGPERLDGVAPRQLDPDRPRQGLVRRAASLQPAAAVLRQDAGDRAKSRRWIDDEAKAL